MIKQFLEGALLVFLFLHQENDVSFTPAQFLQTKDTLIEVGDHKLHFVITKAGEPTVLLEAGGGADASQWKEIQQRLANETSATILSYDRAGFGTSELPSNPYNLKEEVQDLQKCLESLGINKIILVGHSYGAFLNQAFQFMYPKNVVAIILVDPNSTTFVDSLGMEKLMRIPFDTTKPLSTTQKAEVRQTLAFPQTIQSLRDMPYSKVKPIIVISAGKDWWPFTQWNRWWKNSQRTIVNASQNRTMIIAEGSAHNIPKERPDLVVGAIIRTLKE